MGQNWTKKSEARIAATPAKDGMNALVMWEDTFIQRDAFYQKKADVKDVTQRPPPKAPPY